MKQTTDTVLMVRPQYFKFNTQTAASNAFQNEIKDLSADALREKVLAEFDDFVGLLRHNGIHVIVIEDTAAPETPDAVFPNNWVMFHPTGQVSLFPMAAPNRRLERRPDIIEGLRENFNISDVQDLSQPEIQNRFLEGTGSMVFDHANKVGYACISPRTDKVLFTDFCITNGYTPVTFTSVDENGQQIYHTNVMMCVGKKLAVICLDSIPDAEERQQVLKSMQTNGLKIVDISFDQMNHFAGNMLQLTNAKGKEFLVMSDQAYKALTKEQVSRIEEYCEILHPELYTIEEIGGGSARCMMAEVFLPKKG